MQNCAAIILAAGNSSRLGEPKQLLVFEGETLLARTVRIARESQARPVIVVLGAWARECAETIAGQPVRIVQNPDWREGIASSIRAGIANVPGETDAAVILLCDQPGMGAEQIDALIMSGRPIAACAHGGTAGPPAYFEKRFFPELLLLEGDKGAKALLARHADQAAVIDFPGGDCDVDTRADWERLCERVIHTSGGMKPDEIERYGKRTSTTLR